MPQLIKTSCHLEILQREYGRDAPFLTTHRGLYRRTIGRLRTRLLRLQISTGDLGAARGTARSQGAPLHLRLFPGLPDGWGRTALAGYRQVKKTAQRLSGGIRTLGAGGASSSPADRE